MVSEVVNKREEPEDRRRRALLGLLAIVAIVALILWWLLSQMAAVPDVMGLSRAEAESTLEAAGFTAGDVISVDATEKEKPGTVVQQTPLAGDRMPKGSRVGLVLAKEFAEETPQVASPTAGLIDESYLDQPEEGRDTDNVGLVPESPPAASGPQVPLVLDKSASAARSILSSAGYRVVFRYEPSTTGVPKGLAFKQDPAPEAREPHGTAVTVWISTGHP